MFKLWKRIKFVFQLQKSIPFLISFFRSKEVAGSKKGLSILFLVAYILLPTDLIPDFFGLIGFVDDLTIFTFVFQQIVKMAPDSLKEKYELE
ncbi:YkvA family protein [Pontibacillus salicampi]|uniref:YkvA family protein n=1 Tax=Pontibacillus salicampi TaxID=1449801 RepID=A0ABV6LN73_9BACI